MPTPRTPREVTSFVRRSSRMTPSQRRAWDAHHRQFVLPVPRGDRHTSVAGDAALDLAAAYGREAPLVVEVGPGMGDSLVPMAAARPEVDVLAFEVYEPAIARILARLAAERLGNVRLVAADAVPGLTVLLAPATIAELWVFFPDPWPKARHHKRRLVTRTLADLAADRLAPGGLWRLATDWPDYAEQIRMVLDAHPALVRLGADELVALPARPLTRFERRAQQAGRPVTDLAYRRRA